MDSERASSHDALFARRAARRRAEAEYEAARRLPEAGPDTPVPPWAPTVVHTPTGVPHGRADPTTVVPLPPAPPPIQGLHRAEAPRHESRRRVHAWSIGAGIVALVLVAVAGVAVLTGGGTGGPLPAAPAASPPPAAPPGTPVAPAGAQARLDDQVRTDAAALAPLVDRWVPQLYAEQPGARRGATTMDAETILRDYTAVKAQYPDALLLASGNFTSFALPGYYVMVAPRPFATPAEVLAWCGGQQRAGDYCFAKRLSRTTGPDGNTVYRN